MYTQLLLVVYNPLPTKFESRDEYAGSGVTSFSFPGNINL